MARMELLSFQEPVPPEGMFDQLVSRDHAAIAFAGITNFLRGLYRSNSQYVFDVPSFGSILYWRVPDGVIEVVRDKDDELVPMFAQIRRGDTAHLYIASSETPESIAHVARFDHSTEDMRRASEEPDAIMNWDMTLIVAGENGVVVKPPEVDGLRDYIRQGEAIMPPDEW